MKNTQVKKQKLNEGAFVLENAKGETVHYLRWESDVIYVVFRRDNRRIETLSSVKELKENEVPYVLLATTSPEKVQKAPLYLGEAGSIRWNEEDSKLPTQFELAEEDRLDTKKMLAWSFAAQAALLIVFAIAGLSSTKKENSPTEVTLIPQEMVEKMLEREVPPTPPAPKAEMPKPTTPARNVVVAPSMTKITKNTPVPKQSMRMSKNMSRRGGGGWKNEGKRGFGTNEKHMNEIGALNALDTSPRVKGGNGGRGGLNLQAVGTEAGSGAGGKGYGGFGANGAGGHGKGGLGKGKGMGLANAMYGKGLIAAPFGEGGAAPGAGGYGTRGASGGGAQGAGYGRQTIVGSWKGTGPRGDGPGGAGWGKGGDGLGPGEDSGDAFVDGGGLEMAQVEEVIMRNMGQIIYCYEQGLQVKSSLSGRVAVRWDIGGNGRVRFAKIRNSSLRSAQVEGCITGKIKNWQFPKPQGGVTVAVTYPFNLTRSVQR